MKFIIENKLYDTEKMKLVGRVKKWYEYEGYCDLYRSQKGNWLLVHIGEQGGCQNCIFRKFGADHWNCHIDAFDLAEVKRQIEAKKKNRGYL